MVADSWYVNRIVPEILDLSGVEAGRLKLSIEAVEIGDVLQQVISSMGPAADKAGIHLKFERAATKIFARADIQRLRQVLINLVSNAIKYNKPGGFVEVSAGKFENKIRISVIDNGIGIAREHHEHVFDAFNRLGAERSGIEGVGIGLSLSRQLVWAMSGDIGFASNQDRGMTFWIEVPVSAAHEYGGSGLDSPSLEVGRRLGGYSLLYIEDHPSSQSLMKSLVATLDDVHLISAPSGPIGLELAVAHRPDVIVLDLNLPEMDGYAILKALQSRPETWSTPVLALTAAASSKEVESGLAAGFFRYLTKPVDVMEFLDAVDAAMQAINRTADSSNSRGVKVERLGDRVSDATSSSSH